MENNEISDEKFKKNSELLKKYWILEIDDTLKNVKNTLRHFFSGIWGLLLNRFVVFIYDFFLSPDLREQAILQFEPVLDGARILNSNNLDHVVDLYFEEFKKNDVGFLRCSHKHEKFPELVEKMKESFIMRIKGTNKLLSTDGEFYSELVRNAYKTKEAAAEVMGKALDLAKNTLDFSVENKMLRISPLVKNQIIRVLYEEWEYKRKDLEEKLDIIFSGENF